jgi:hypothetical protein
VAVPTAALTPQVCLECQELATRVLLDLDATPCGAAAELRVVRKRLVARANALLDAVQAATRQL